MLGSRVLLALCVLALARRGRAQAAFPDSSQDIAVKFNLELPAGQTTISTQQGATTASLASVLDVQGKFVAGESALNKGFVKANGTQFYLNGNPFYCAGTNAYYAALKYIMSDSEVAYMMKVHASKGATIMRVFANSNFNTVPDPIMPTFGQYNESSFQRLDLALVAAAQHGIRLILVLGNYWPFLGGMQEWVDQSLGTGHPIEAFYMDPTVRQHFKDWIRTLITRTNSITGVKYVDDPTIFSWELANEPRSGEDYEKNNGLSPGSLVCNWAKEMSSYIKSLDANHMVNVGDEGFQTGGSAAAPHSWLNNGYEGVDMTCNINIPTIDFATVHPYPDNWGIPASEYQWIGPNFIKDRAAIAHKANKPVVLEEYGMQPGYLASRDILLDYILSQANAEDYACTLVWAVDHYSVDAGYNFGYDNDGGKSTIAQYKYMNDKNSGGAKLPNEPAPAPPTCTDVPPPGNSYTCQQQKAWGKCSASWMNGYCKQTCGTCN